MHQLFRIPPADMPTPQPRRRGESNGTVLVGFVVACLLIVGVIGALVWTGVLKHQSFRDLQGDSPLTTSLGEPLTINNVTVTLTSATALTVNQSGASEQATSSGAPGQTTSSGPPQQTVIAVTFTLHFQNQTTSDQHLSMAHWQFLDSGENSYTIVVQNGDLTVSLAPGATLDRQYSSSGVGGYSPYTLLTDVTTPNGAILGWTFAG